MKNSSYVLLCMLIFLTKDFKTTKSKQMYIVGGRDVSIKNHPYVVSIIIKHRSKLSFRGAAAIVHRHYAMTTAATIHFIAPNMIKHKFVYLRGNTANWSDGVTGKDHQIDDIKKHDGFSEVTFDEDFAIIKVKEPFNGRNERLIAIAGRDYEYSGSTTIFGWGSNAPEKFRQVDILRAVEVDLWDTEKCKEVYNVEGAVVRVTESMVCAGNEGRDTCTKDGGGPMIQNNTLIGIISWGSECGNANYPTVYSKIGHFDSFIRRTADMQGIKFLRKEKRLPGDYNNPDYYCRRNKF